VDGWAVSAAASNASGRGLIPGLSRPTISVEKFVIFCKPASGDTFWSTATKYWHIVGCQTCDTCHTYHKYQWYVSLVFKCVIVGLLITNFNQVRREWGVVQKVIPKLCSQPKAKTWNCARKFTQNYLCTIPFHVNPDLFIFLFHLCWHSSRFLLPDSILADTGFAKFDILPVSFWAESPQLDTILFSGH
jgi:hypothetical protein